MAMKYLGESFCIHGVGEDWFVRHSESESAQSEAYTGRPLARYWLHNGMVTFRAEKMSKSLGNVLSIREVVKRHDPDAFRLFVLGTHYRHPIEWSEERVQESARAVERLTRLIHDVQTFWSGAAGDSTLPDELRTFRTRFVAALDDDFNTPQALGVLFELSHALYEYAEHASVDAGARAAGIAGVQEMRARLRGPGFLEPRYAPLGAPPEIQRL